MTVFAKKQMVLDALNAQLRVQRLGGGSLLSLTLYDTQTGAPLGGMTVEWDEWDEFVRRIPLELTA